MVKPINFIHLPTKLFIKGDYTAGSFVKYIYSDKKSVDYKICLYILKLLIKDKSVNKKDLVSKVTSQFRSQSAKNKVNGVIKKLESIGLIRRVAAREHVKYLLTPQNFIQLLRIMINHWTSIYRR